MTVVLQHQFWNLTITEDRFEVELSFDNGSPVLDELVDIISLSACNVSVKKKNVDVIEISPQVISQLSDFLSILASYYRENAFHNFEHVRKCHLHVPLTSSSHC